MGESDQLLFPWEVNHSIHSAKEKSVKGYKKNFSNP